MARQDYSTFFESRSITSTTTGVDADVVYTVPPNHDCEITFCGATNGGASGNISILVYHADHASYCYIVRDHSISGNNTYKFIESDRIYLHAGDKVVAYKGSGTIDISVSGKQFYNPSRGI